MATPCTALITAQVAVGAGLTIMVQLAVAVPAALPVESTTVAVKLNVPAVVGVPVMAPVLAFNVRPAGRLPPVIEYV